MKTSIGLFILMIAFLVLAARMMASVGFRVKEVHKSHLVLQPYLPTDVTVIQVSGPPVTTFRNIRCKTVAKKIGTTLATGSKLETRQIFLSCTGHREFLVNGIYFEEANQ